MIVTEFKQEPWCAVPSLANPHPQPELHTYVRIPATRVWLLIASEPLPATEDQR